jgi:hypothetical protein
MHDIPITIVKYNFFFFKLTLIKLNQLINNKTFKTSPLNVIINFFESI